MDQNKKLNLSLKLIVKSSIFVFIGFVIAKIFGYLYRIIIARYFGPEIYGLFSLAIIILVWFVTIASLGFSEGIIRFASLYRGKKEFEKIKYLLKFSLIFLLITGIISGLILYSMSGFISIKIFNNQDLIIFLKIISFIIPIYLLSNTFLAIIQSFERIKFYSFLADFLNNFIKLSTLIVLIFIGFNSNSLIFSFMLGTISIFLGSYLYCKYKIPELFGIIKIKNETKKEVISELFYYSWPLIFSSIFYNVLPYLDSFLIGYFNGATDVGIYNAAVPIAELLMLTPFLFARLFFPLITREYSQKNFEVIKELSKQVEKWILILNLPLFILILLFPGAFINILFGSEYILAENSLRFLAIGFLFFTLSVVLSYLITMIGKSKTILINIIIVSILNLILNILLIPRYGISGAAFATMISHIILASIYFFQVKYYISITPLRRKMFGIIISAIIPTLVLLYIRQFITINLTTIIIQVSFFLLIYLFLIFITRSLDKNDIMILNSFKGKIFKS